MKLPRLRCLLDDHTPVRNRVHSDGPRTTGVCEGCGASIWRRDHRDWRRLKRGEYRA